MMRRFIESLEGRTLMAMTAVGAEFRVNTATAGDQYAPVVAADSSGNFVAAWVGNDGSDTGILFQLFSSNGAPLGSETVVNTVTAGTQAQPAVAMNASGAFVVTWNTNGDIAARRFSSSGVPLDANELAINTVTTGNQESPAIAIDSLGNFVIVWDSDSNPQDTSSFGVFARLFATSGSALTSEFLVNQTTLDLQADPTIAMDGSGNFIVAWDSGSITNVTQYDIFARRFNATGTPLANEFEVNTYTTDYQVFPAAGMDTAGDFVIVWNSLGQDGDQNGVYARRFNSSGTAIDASEFQVNTTSADNQVDPMVSMDSGGDFMVAWSSDNRDGSGQAVFARKFDSGGGSTSEFSVNSFTSGDQQRPDVVLVNTSTAVVVWQSQFEDSSGFGVYAQRYGAPAVSTPTVSSANFSFQTGHVLYFVFSKTVLMNLSEGDLILQNLTTSTTVSNSAMKLWYSGGTNPAFVTFPGFSHGVLPDGNYRATLVGSGITDVNGTNLDGDNNGSPGGNYTFDFFVLSGDANHDRIVDAADLSILSANWQAAPRTYPQGDFNYDFVVNILDLYILSSHWQQSLPAPPPPSPPLSSTPASLVTITSARRTATSVATTLVS